VPEVSAIVVSYQTPELLRRCLELLTRERGQREIEILVVENHSGDASPEVARSFPGVRLLETGRNLGFAGGVNRGLELAKGRFLLVLNPDVEITPGAIDTLVDHLERHPEAGVAAPKLLNSDGSLQYSCRRDYTFLTVLLRRTFLGRLFPNAAALRHHLMQDFDHEEVRAVDWVSGAAMMVRAEAIADVGPMDERYFLYFEDVDWCTRMRARGWKVEYVPQAVMTHHWQRESRGLSGAARRHIQSGLRFLDRWSLLLYVTRRYQAVWSTFALVATDILVVAGSFLAAYFFRQQLAFLLERPVWPLSFYASFFTASTLLFLVVFAAQGMYRAERGDAVDLFFRVLKAATTAALALMAMTFLLRMRGYSRVIVIGAWPLVVAGAFLTRLLIRKLQHRARRERWTLRRIALLGNEPILDRIEAALHEHPQWGWEPIRVRQVPPPGPGGEEALLNRLAGERAGEVVLTPEFRSGDVRQRSATLLALRQAGLGIHLAAEFLTDLPLRAQMESAGEIAWLSLQEPGLTRRRNSKWFVDRVLGLGMGLLGGLPFLGCLLVLGIRRRRVWEPRTPFRGRWGVPFHVRRLAGGGWFRDYPLLGNILRGEMSFVGPRPLRPGEPVPGGEPWLRVREQVRPGWAGPWRLGPPLDLQEEMRQELRYLEDSTVEQDLKILVRILLQNPGTDREIRSFPTGDLRNAGLPTEAARSEPFVDLRS